MLLSSQQSDVNLLVADHVNKCFEVRVMHQNIDIDIEDLFTVEYGKPFNISSVVLFLRQPYVK